MITTLGVSLLLSQAVHVLFSGDLVGLAGSPGGLSLSPLLPAAATLNLAGPIPVNTSWLYRAMLVDVRPGMGDLEDESTPNRHWPTIAPPWSHALSSSKLGTTTVRCFRSWDDTAKRTSFSTRRTVEPSAMVLTNLGAAWLGLKRYPEALARNYLLASHFLRQHRVKEAAAPDVSEAGVLLHRLLAAEGGAAL
jgi:hypothetical protein